MQPSVRMNQEFREARGNSGTRGTAGIATDRGTPP